MAMTSWVSRDISGAVLAGAVLAGAVMGGSGCFTSGAEGAGSASKTFLSAVTENLARAGPD